MGARISLLVGLGAWVAIAAAAQISAAADVVAGVGVKHFQESYGSLAFGTGAFLLIMYAAVFPIVKWMREDKKAELEARSKEMDELREERRTERDETSALRRAEIEALNAMAGSLGGLAVALKEMNKANVKAMERCANAGGN